jgi:hypothetical protein
MNLMLIYMPLPMDNEDVMPHNLLGTYKHFTETYHFQLNKSVNHMGKRRFTHVKCQDQCCKQANVRLLPSYGLKIIDRKRDTYTALKFSPPFFIKNFFLSLPLSKIWHTYVSLVHSQFSLP